MIFRTSWEMTIGKSMIALWVKSVVILTPPSWAMVIYVSLWNLVDGIKHNSNCLKYALITLNNSKRKDQCSKSLENCSEQSSKLLDYSTPQKNEHGTQKWIVCKGGSFSKRAFLRFHVSFLGCIWFHFNAPPKKKHAATTKNKSVVTN